jgi:protein phosphatase
MTVSVGFEAAGRTHVGLVRQRNEDAFYVGEHLVAVADGLGGHVGGDVASTTAIEAVRDYDRPTGPGPGEMVTTLVEAVDAANRALRASIAMEPGLAGMGTTLVALLWSTRSIAVASIGDSRIYRLRGGRTDQITDDHVYARLVSGAERVPQLPERLVRFLNGRPDGVSPDLTAREVCPGDRYLLCSDGLSSFVERSQIHATLADVRDPGEAADRLVASANDAGGPDNVTVIVLDVH